MDWLENPLDCQAILNIIAGQLGVGWELTLKKEVMKRRVKCRKDDAVLSGNRR